MKRTEKLALCLVGFGYVAACAGFIYLFWALNRPPAGAPAEQDRIVAAVQAFRERHGRLPESLQEAGIEFDRDLFDSVSYSKAFDNPNAFDLDCWKDYWGPTPTR